MSTDLVESRAKGNGSRVAEPSGPMTLAYSVDDVWKIASHVGGSKLFGMTADQAFSLMMLCMSDGLDPIQAVRRYHIIQGRPSMRADAMHAEFQRRGGLIEWVECTDRGCVAVFKHPRYAPQGERIEFTEEDARRAQLLGKENYRHYPRDMYRARVISIGIRMIDPGIVVGIYTPEEMADPLPDDRAGRQPIRWRDAAGGRAGPAAAPPEERRESDIRKYIRGCLEMANDELRRAMIVAGKEHPGKVIVANEFQTANALVSEWIQEGVLDEQAVLTDGKRDKVKLGVEVLRLYRDARGEVEKDIRDYVKAKRDEAYRHWGLEPPPSGFDDADEAQAAADEDPDEEGEV